MKKIVAVVLLVGCVGVFLWSKLKSSPRREPTQEELMQAARNLVFQDVQRTDKDPDLIALGKALFFDASFSASNSVACSTCHIPEKFFTDGKMHAFGMAETSMNTPTVANARMNHWFFWNGRADSLAMQALGPVENSQEHGFSRVAVAKRLAEAYRAQYEALFHKIPDYIATLPNSQAPPPPRAYVSLPVAAYALATLSNTDSLKAILKAAQAQKLQPADYLARGKPSTYDDTFTKLTDVQQDAVNQMFANFGLAIAAFEETIVSHDSPFDKFATRFMEATNQNKDSEHSFNENFSAQEFAGFKLFVGHGRCITCHNGPNFTDQQFHNIGLPDFKGTGDIDLGRSLGLIQVLRSPFNCRGPYLRQTTEILESCREEEYLDIDSTEFVGAFKTPSLRNVSETAPYMHDGSIDDLDGVLGHYNKLKIPPGVGHREETLQPLNLSQTELQQLKAFLTSLKGQVTHD